MGRWLDRAWWPIWPVHVWLVAAMTTERVCGGGADVLSRLSMRPLPAALLAAVYVAAHAWLAMAVLMTTAGMRVAAAPGEVPARVWTGRSVRLMLMVVIFGVDYLPRTIMRLAMSGVCRP